MELPVCSVLNVKITDCRQHVTTIATRKALYTNLSAILSITRYGLTVIPSTNYAANPIRSEHIETVNQFIMQSIALEFEPLQQLKL